MTSTYDDGSHEKQTLLMMMAMVFKKTSTTTMLLAMAKMTANDELPMTTANNNDHNDSQQQCPTVMIKHGNQQWLPMMTWNCLKRLVFLIDIFIANNNINHDQDMMQFQHISKDMRKHLNWKAVQDAVETSFVLVDRYYKQPMMCY